MNLQDRKAAVSAYKERKVVAGVFAVRCPATGEAWIGKAPDLSTIQNRLWFTLRQGSHMNRVLQAAWQSHGPAAFTFEIVERFDDEEDALAHLRERERQGRLDRWAAALGAAPI